MPRRTAAALVACATLLLCGCIGHPAIDPPMPMPMPPAALTLADSGSGVELKPGDTLVIHLDEAPGTGYRWTVENGATDILALVDTTYAPPQGTVSTVGGAGVRAWTFEARAAGAGRLVLKRTRAWLKTDPAATSFELDVRVSR